MKVDQDQLDAWIAIARGLDDEWPLVREAFQEQLTAAFEKVETLRTLITEGVLLDRVGGQSLKLLYADQNTLVSADNSILTILLSYL